MGVLIWVVIGGFWWRGEGFRWKIVQIRARANLQGEGAVAPADNARVGLVFSGLGGVLPEANGSGS